MNDRNAIIAMGRKDPTPSISMHNDFPGPMLVVNFVFFLIPFIHPRLDPIDQNPPN